MIRIKSIVIITLLILYVFPIDPVYSKKEIEPGCIFRAKVTNLELVRKFRYSNVSKIKYYELTKKGINLPVEGSGYSCFAKLQTEKLTAFDKKYGVLRNDTYYVSCKLNKTPTSEIRSYGNFTLYKDDERTSWVDLKLFSSEKNSIKLKPHYRITLFCDRS